MIPRILHRVVPATTSTVVEGYWQAFREMHKGWEFRTWRDPLDSHDFPLLGDLFRHCKTGAGLADLIRLEVLWREGGVYVDSDCEPIRPFDPLLSHACFVGREDENHLTNAVIGAARGHPAIEAYIAAIREAGPRGLRRPPNEASGPHMATAVWRHRDDVTVLPPAYFYGERPNSDPLNLRPTALEIAAVHPDAVVVHRWAHSWAPSPPLRDRMRRALGHAHWMARQRLTSSR